MYSGTYEIAGVLILIRSLYPEVQALCRDYAQEGSPELTVTTEQKDIDYEAMKNAREAQVEGIPLTVFPDSYLETLAVYRKIVEYMLTKKDTLLFHGSAIAVEGRAYLFTATSGTGKSTHTRLWRQLLGEKAVMVNDDKPLLRIADRGVEVCGTPWNGKHRLGNPITVPLKAIVILERGTENEIHPITVREALPMLMQQSYHPLSPADYPLYLSLLDRLCHSLRFYRLRCNMDPEAARVAYEGLKEG